MRAWFGAWLVAASAAGVLGCSHHGRRRPPAPASALPLEGVLPVTRARAILVDDRQIGSIAAVDDVLRPSSPQPAQHRALSAEQCQCLAVKASSEGNSLASERRALVSTATPHGFSEEERLKVQVLWASELEARNHSAATALTVYYHIAQAEANRPIVDRSLQELDDALGNVARLREQGMQVPFDEGELRRQRLALLDKRLALTSQLDQQNAQLIQLLGLQTSEIRPRLWPAADFTVAAAAFDIELAVAVGLANRPELRLLSSLRASLKAKNVDITRDVVGGASTLLGSQHKFTGVISLLGVREILGQRRSQRRELPTRQRQLADYYDQRRREVTMEIQQAALEVESTLRRTAVEKQAVVEWRTELDELAKKSQIDEATFLDISRARLKRLQAESDEVEQIVAWKIAQVKVKEAQGMLVAECQGGHCKFLDYPVVHEMSGGPPAEFVAPQDDLPDGVPDNLPEPDGGFSRAEPLGGGDSPARMAAAPAFHSGSASSAEPVSPAPAVERLPSDNAASEADLPDVAVEPPLTPADTLDPDA